MSLLKRLPGNEIVAVCDVYEPNLLQAVEIAGTMATKVADYRRILDSRDIDAVVIGTPDHWHKTMTLDAVGAGKDVYVEKPVSHSIGEGEEMVRGIEASNQIVQTGTQQRSWEHWMLGKQIVDSGRLGQITFVHTYWYQHMTAGNFPPVAMDKLDWKAWLGSAPDQPFKPEQFYQWRHFWDFGGGCLTDLMTHWIDVVHWYMNVDAPVSASTTGHNYNITTWEAPDTVTTAIEFPKKFMSAYLGTYVSRVDDGGLEFRCERGTLKVDRVRLALYRDDAATPRERMRRSPKCTSARAATGRFPTSRTGSIAFAAARRRTRTSASDIKRRGRRTSPTPRCAPAGQSAGTPRPQRSRRSESCVPF
jgi:predicted dehydrogenase